MHYLLPIDQYDSALLPFGHPPTSLPDSALSACDPPGTPALLCTQATFGSLASKPSAYFWLPSPTRCYLPSSPSDHLAGSAQLLPRSPWPCSGLRPVCPPRDPVVALHSCSSLGPLWLAQPRWRPCSPSGSLQLAGTPLTPPLRAASPPVAPTTAITPQRLCTPHPMAYCDLLLVAICALHQLLDH